MHALLLALVASCTRSSVRGTLILWGLYFYPFDAEGSPELRRGQLDLDIKPMMRKASEENPSNGRYSTAFLSTSPCVLSDTSTLL